MWLLTVTNETFWTSAKTSREYKQQKLHALQNQQSWYEHWRIFIYMVEYLDDKKPFDFKIKTTNITMAYFLLWPIKTFFFFT